MMYPLDALKLARTKLKTRRVRLTVTVTTMSLLFAGLFFIATVLGGLITSLKSFGKEGLGTRYLVAAQPTVAQVYSNDELLDALKPTQADIVARKKALAKKLSIEYDEKTDQSLPLSTYQNGPNSGDVQTNVNFMSSIATAKLQEQNAAIKGISYAEFQKRSTVQGATHVYRGTSTMMGPPPVRTDGGSIIFLKDGKEDFDANSKGFSGQPTGLESITTLGWHQIDDELLKPFVLDGQTTATKDGAIPIIAPYSAAEQAAGLKNLPATATAEEKIARTVQLRKAAAGKTAQLCYRNSASQALLQKAVSQQAEIAANKINKDYTMPHLLYTLPTTPCGETTIKSDKRTAEEKKADNNQQTFEAAFTNITPTQGVVTVRIVGIVPDINYGASFNATALLAGIFSTTLGQGWFSPTSAFQPGTLATTAQDGVIADQPLTQQQYYAEFATLAAAKQFIKLNSCSSDAMGGITGVYDPNRSIKTCIAANTPFYISPFGNNAGAIEDIQHSIWTAGRYVLLVVLLIASLVMMGTLGKIISDSRRETAVFRSLGATRVDIRQIYFTYAFLVSLLVIVASYVIGLLAAHWLSGKYSGQLSASAVVAYNARDVHKQFSLFGFEPLYVLIIIGLILVSAFLSAMIPLMANTRRNPIRDMRDDS
ncbi:ABC transporter permease [Candidatus Saccharibacteria bacterium]|nr:MAG: ABC transporter permease [Candidatus Saccharibacteria bacterium]